MRDKTIVITGASGNLGLAFCERFGREGVRIAALDLHPQGLQALSDYLQSKQIEHEVFVCDITNRTQCLSVLQAVQARFGRVDVLINNAGITHIQRFREMDGERDIVRRVMEVNLLGAVYCTEAVLSQLIQHKGLIINISSVAGFAPLLGRTAYSASKHALHGFFESLRAELHADGVHCLMVCPSFVAAQSPIATNSDSPIYQPKKIIGNALDPQTIADAVYRAALRRRRILVLGRTGKLSYWMQRLFPALYERLMRRKLEKEL